MVHQRSSENNKHDQSKFQASEGVHAKSCIQASIPPSPAELYPRADKGLAQGHTKVAQLVEPRSSKTEGLILPAGQEFLSCFLSLDCRVLPSLTWSGQCPAAFFFQRTRASPPMDSVFGRPGGRPGPRGTRSETEGRRAHTRHPAGAGPEALAQAVTLTWSRDGHCWPPSRPGMQSHLRASHSLRCLLFRVCAAIS